MIEQLASQILLEAAQVLESGWTQGAGARDGNGKPVPPDNSSARCWSAVGSVSAVYAIERDRARMPNLVDAAFREAILTLARTLEGPDAPGARHARSELAFAVESITHWNDASGRTAVEVIAACSAAGNEALARAKEGDALEIGATAGPEAGPVRVLIAEDDVPYAAMLTTLLEANPRLRVVGQAYDGEEAVELARETAPDIALVDISMPLMSGFEVTRVMREASPRTRVLIVTGSDAAADVDTARDAGAAGYVLKDAVSSDLIRVIASLVAES